MKILQLSIFVGVLSGQLLGGNIVSSAEGLYNLDEIDSRLDDEGTDKNKKNNNETGNSGEGPFSGNILNWNHLIIPEYFSMSNGEEGGGFTRIHNNVNNLETYYVKDKIKKKVIFKIETTLDIFYYYWYEGFYSEKDQAVEIYTDEMVEKLIEQFQGSTLNIALSRSSDSLQSFFKLLKVIAERASEENRNKIKDITVSFSANRIDDLEPNIITENSVIGIRDILSKYFMNCDNFQIGGIATRDALSFDDTDQKFDGRFVLILRSVPGLNRLSFSNSVFTDGFFRNLKKIKNLNTFMLKNCGKITEDQWKNLVAALGQWPDLKILNFSQNEQSTIAIRPLFSVLTKKESLEQVDITDNPLTEGFTLEEFPLFLAQMKALKELKFTFIFSKMDVVTKVKDKLEKLGWSCDYEKKFTSAGAYRGVSYLRTNMTIKKADDLKSE